MLEAPLEIPQLSMEYIHLSLRMVDIWVSLE